MTKKKGTLFILSLIFFISTPAQYYQVGAGLTASLPNKYTKIDGGFQLFAEYITESQFSFRTGGGFSISKFSDENVYLNDLRYSFYWLEGSLIYYPVKTIFEPYVGSGIGFYFISHETLNRVETTNTISEPQELSNKFSFHIKAGFVYPLHTSIKLHLQGKYFLFEQDLIVKQEETIDSDIMKRTVTDEIDLSKIFITLGVILKI